MEIEERALINSHKLAGAGTGTAANSIVNCQDMIAGALDLLQIKGEQLNVWLARN